MTEFDDLFRFASTFGVQSYLEIGAYQGNSLRNAHRWLGFTRAVVVDLENAGSGGCRGTGARLKTVCNELTEQGVNVELIQQNSHDPEVIARIQSMPQFDLVLIDGDHSKEGCHRDWEAYGGRGRLVAFHDILSPIAWPWVGVLWNYLITTHQYAVFQRGERLKGGVGLIINDTGHLPEVLR